MDKTASSHQPESKKNAHQHKQNTGPIVNANDSRAPYDAGNLALQYWVQTKMQVSQPDDPYEREADQVADQVMRKPADKQRIPIRSVGQGVYRKCNACADEDESHGDGTVQLKGKQNNHAPGGISSRSVAAATRGGEPLGKNARAFFEPRFGRSFSDVKVHTGGYSNQVAQSLNAKAFTRGKHIVFGSGQYRPETDTGKQLIAHELTHVVQQQNLAAERPIQRDALDPANPTAWSFIGSPHRRAGWAKDTFTDTLSAAPEAAMNLENDIRQAGDPDTDAEKAAFESRARRLVRLNALGLMAAHRATIEGRQKEMIRSFEGRTEPQGEFDREVLDRGPTLKRIRTTATKVHQLQQLKEELDGYRSDLAVVSSQALLSSSSASNINDFFNTIADSAANHNSPKIRNYLRSTARSVFGRRRDGDELRLFASVIAGYLRDWRQGQISGIDLALSKIYEAYPFFSELDAEDFADGDYADDDALEKAVREAYQEILEDIDSAIVDIGSEDIHPFDLPEAVKHTKNTLPAELHTDFDEVLSDHQLTEFWLTLGLTFAQIALMFVPVVGPALAAGVGLADLAMQAEQMLDQMTMSDAATNPQGELLGVGGPGTLDWALLAVTAILTAADLGMVAREFRAARGAMALDALRLSEGQIDELAALIDAGRLDPDDVARLGRINDETLEAFQRNPELLGALTDNPLAAAILKRCASPCYPPNATREQIEAVNEFLGRARGWSGKSGPFNEAHHNMLREFFYARRNNLDQAIADANRIGNLNQLEASLRNAASDRASRLRHLTHRRAGTPTPPLPAEPRTREFRHARAEHGARNSPVDMRNRAMSTRGSGQAAPNGQWYDDRFIVEATHQVSPDTLVETLASGRQVHQVRMAYPVGRVYMPDGSIISDVRDVLVVLLPNGQLRNAYPISLRPNLP